MPLLTVSAGGPEIDAGVYSVTLIKIEGPKTITPQSGPNANTDVEIYDWTFVVDEGDFKDVELQGTTSVSSGPRSKMFAWLTALLGGKPPAVGASFEIGDLAGRQALATISKSESGWPRIENLGALPKAMQRQTAPAPAASGLRQQVADASAGADLPF